MATHHITIAGNIGAGKSTLVSLLQEHLGWQAFFEIADEHPYLDDYYQDPPRWGFHSQIWFLSQRYEQHQELRRCAGIVCQDRSIYEDYEVFAKGLLDQGILSQRDFTTYEQLYQRLIRDIQPPSLLVYLAAGPTTLRERIAQRARDYEQDIPAAYLEYLAQRYTQWLSAFDLCPVLTIATDGLDVVQNTNDRQAVIDEISQALKALG